MQGIDRTKTVEFQNSYVLLTNKDAQGNDVGISNIENLIITTGSGIKISANGTITGDFIGDMTQEAIIATELKSGDINKS